MTKSDILAKLQEQREKYDEMQIDYLRQQDENVALMTKVQRLQEQLANTQVQHAEQELFNQILPDFELDYSCLLKASSYVKEVQLQFENLQRTTMESDMQYQTIIKKLNEQLQYSVPKTQVQQLEFSASGERTNPDLEAENQHLRQQNAVFQRELQYSKQQVSQTQSQLVQTTVLLENERTERANFQNLVAQKIDKTGRRYPEKPAENLEIAGLNQKIRNLMAQLQSKDLEIQSYQSKLLRLQEEVNAQQMNQMEELLAEPLATTVKDLQQSQLLVTQMSVQNLTDDLFGPYFAGCQQLQTCQYSSLNFLIEKTQGLVNTFHTTEARNEQLMMGTEQFMAQQIAQIQDLISQYGKQDAVIFEKQREVVVLTEQLSITRKSQDYYQQKYEATVEEAVNNYTRLLARLQNIDNQLVNGVNGDEKLAEMRADYESQFQELRNYLQAFHDEQLKQFAVRKTIEIRAEIAEKVRAFRNVIRQNLSENNLEFQELDQLDVVQELNVESLNLNEEINLLIAAYVNSCRKIDSLKQQLKNQKELEAKLAEQSKHICDLVEEVQRHKNTIIEAQALIKNLSQVKDQQTKIKGELTNLESQNRIQEGLLNNLTMKQKEWQTQTIEGLARVHVYVTNIDPEQVVQRETQTLEVRTAQVEIQCEIKQDLVEEQINKLVSATMMMGQGGEKQKAPSPERFKSMLQDDGGRSQLMARTSPLGKQLNKTGNWKQAAFQSFVQPSKHDHIFNDSDSELGSVKQTTGRVVDFHNFSQKLQEVATFSPNNLSGKVPGRAGLQKIANSSNIILTQEVILAQNANSYVQNPMLLDDPLAFTQQQQQLMNDPDFIKQQEQERRRAYQQIKDNLQSPPQNVPVTKPSHVRDNNNNSSKIQALKSQLGSKVYQSRRQPGQSALTANLAAIKYFE